jgi:hypothetical protein
MNIPKLSLISNDTFEQSKNMPKPRCLSITTISKDSVKQQHKTEALQRHVNYYYSVLVELHHVGSD